MSDIALLSLIIFLPTIGAVVISGMRSEGGMRSFANFVTAATFVLTLLILPKYDASVPGIQLAVSKTWIATWNVNYQPGVDGISLPLVILTSLISWLAMLASTSVTKQIKGYLILFLILETGMLGVFLALDFFLFYVFWEVMLLPMYFLIGIWGGPRREYAAIKFFLYTLVGGVLMLIALLMLYFNSDLGAVAQKSDFYGDPSMELKWATLHVNRGAEARLGRVYLPDALDAPDNAGPQSSKGRVAVTRAPDFRQGIRIKVESIQNG